MPRSNQPRRRTSPRRPGEHSDDGEADLNRSRLGIPATESAPDGVWAVRTISSGNAQKAYTCPGCHRQITPGTPHLVVWQEDALFGDEAGLRDRRHWHSNCWRGRSYRYR
ncbi:hypothetical protein [Arthrobacter alpinus]|uniref:hypothetical protein n=1 Tax=Arthrobacter alpinus TaxID=656366 RepID=UPI0009425B42|nr:hypothetical protein [Arthrobacter alpinus]